MGDIGLTFLGILLFLTSFFMMLLILVQRGKGGGLTGALGGMGGQSAFGSKAGDVFTRITVITAIIWITLCMVTTAAYNPPPKNDLTKKEMPSLESFDDEEAGMGGMGAGDDSAAAASEGQGSETAEPPADMEDDLSGLLSDDDAEGAESTDADASEADDDDGPSLGEPEGSGDSEDDN